MNIQEHLQVDFTRGIVVTTRGVEIPIKEHNGWKYINYKGTKLGVSKLPQYKAELDDPVVNYICDGGFKNFPCPAMDYWIIRHRLKKKISYAEFKLKYSHTFIHFKSL